MMFKRRGAFRAMPMSRKTDPFSPCNLRLVAAFFPRTFFETQFAVNRLERRRAQNTEGRGCLKSQPAKAVGAPATIRS
jgi:hypothetical protein